VDNVEGRHAANGQTKKSMSSDPVSSNLYLIRRGDARKENSTSGFNSLKLTNDMGHNSLPAVEMKPILNSPSFHWQPASPCESPGPIARALQRHQSRKAKTSGGERCFVVGSARRVALPTSSSRARI